IEDHEGDPDGHLVAPSARPGLLRACDLRESLRLVPARAAIVAAPQAMRARAQQQHAPIVGIDGQALAVAAALLVAAHAERQHRALETGAAVARAQDRALG